MGFLLLCIGCGPTPEERYNTALSVLEKEKDAMAEAERSLVSSEDIARKEAYRQMYGEYPMTEEMIEIIRHAELEPGSEHEKKNEAKIQADLDRQAEFASKLHDSDSKQHGLYYDQLKKLKGYVAHEQQKARLERAQSMVRDAESALD